MRAKVIVSIPVLPSPAKAVVRPSDLIYQGSCKLPKTIFNKSTEYSPGCIAFRRVNGQPRLFADAHVNSGGLVYEVDVPQLSTGPTLPTATVVKQWGDIYQGRKKNEVNASVPLNINYPTSSLRWDEAGQCLWWTTGKQFNADDQHAPTLGKTTFNADGSIVASGPWRVNASIFWVRGGTLEIPQGFASQYTGGRRLGVGFGGYYSIIAGGSLGPALLAVDDPTTANTFPGPMLSGKTLLAHPMTQVVQGYEAYAAPRSTDYHSTWLNKGPFNGVGKWCGSDVLGGENWAGNMVWIETPTKHGIVCLPSLGIGECGYVLGQGVVQTGRKSVWYIYDPADLAAIAQGTKKPWEAVPYMQDWVSPHPAYPPSGLLGQEVNMVGGVAWDGVDTLYVCVRKAYASGTEKFSVVHAFKVS